MKNNHKKAFILIIILAALVFFGYRIYKIYAGSWLFGQPVLWDIEMSADGLRIYASYPAENSVVEINTSTLEESRRFSLANPSCIRLSRDGNYLYSGFSQNELQDGLARIRLSDGHVDSLVLGGWITDLEVDPTGERIWAVQRFWPLLGDTDLTFPDEDSGQLTAIATNGALQEINSVIIRTLPNSIYYSPQYSKLYVKHQLVLPGLQWVRKSGNYVFP